MEAIKEKKPTLLNVLFGNNVIETEINDEELINAMNIVDKMGKETENAVHSENKSSKNGGKSGGLGNKVKTPTIDVQEMSPKKLEEMKNKLAKGREIGE